MLSEANLIEFRKIIAKMINISNEETQKIEELLTEIV